MRKGKRVTGGIIIQWGLFWLMTVEGQGPKTLLGGGPAGRALSKKTGTKGERALPVPLRIKATKFARHCGTHQ